jgi:hypothetical protein
VSHVRGSFAVTDYQVAMFLIQESDEEEIEKAAQDIEIPVSLVLWNPVVAKGLEQQADAMHLPVGTGMTAERPSEAILPNQIWQQFDVLFRKSAQAGQLSIAEALVRMELQGLADEYK